MPPCAAFYLVPYLYEIGPTVAAGMGEGPVSQSEIQSWQSNTGIELTSWEARTLRRLSVEYLSESYKAKKPDCLAPWQDAEVIVNPLSQKASSTQNALRALAVL